MYYTKMAQYKLISYEHFDPSCLTFSPIKKASEYNEETEKYEESKNSFQSYINYNNERKQILIQSPKITLDQGGIPPDIFKNKDERFYFKQFFDVNHTKHLNNETDEDRESRSKILKEFEKKLIEIDENVEKVSNLKEVFKNTDLLSDKVIKKLEHKPIVKIVEEDEDDSDDGNKRIKYNSMKFKIGKDKNNKSHPTVKLYQKNNEYKGDEGKDKEYILINTDDYTLDDLKKYIGYAKQFSYCLHFSKLDINKSLNYWKIVLKVHRIKIYPREVNPILELEDKTSKLFLDSDDEEEYDDVKEFIKNDNNFESSESEDSDEEEIKQKKKTRGKELN